MLHEVGPFQAPRTGRPSRSPRHDEKCGSPFSAGSELASSEPSCLWDDVQTEWTPVSRLWPASRHSHGNKRTADCTWDHLYASAQDSSAQDSSAQDASAQTLSKRSGLEVEDNENEPADGCSQLHADQLADSVQTCPMTNHLQSPGDRTEEEKGHKFSFRKVFFVERVADAGLRLYG